MKIDRETRADLWFLSGILFYALPLVVLVIAYIYGKRGSELRDIVFTSAFVLWNRYGCIKAS